MLCYLLIYFILIIFMNIFVIIILLMNGVRRFGGRLICGWIWYKCCLLN